MADQKPKRKAKRPVNKEVGVAGQTLTGVFEDEEVRTDQLKIKDYIEMRDNDGSVAALYEILTLPIIANEWTIQPPEGLESKNPEEDERVQLVKDNLTLPPHRGGMSTPFTLVIGDMLRAVLEGFRLFEKVRTISPDGKIVFKKIAARDAQTVTLKRDDHGGFDGATQRVWYQNEYIETALERDDLFLYTYGKEKNFLYGQSAFKPAHYHYRKKHQLYHLGNLNVQYVTIPAKELIYGDDMGETEIEAAEEAAEKIGELNTVFSHGKDLEAKPWNAKEMKVTELVDHHNAEMARSVLAQYIMLGTGSKTGSFALAESSKEMFLIAQKGLMNSIEEHINFWLLPELIDLNFPEGQREYPEFRFSRMDPKVEELVKEAFVRVAASGSVPQWIIDGLAEKVAESADITKPDDADEEPEETPDEPKGPAPEPQQPAPDKDKDDPDPDKQPKDQRDFLDEAKLGRPLTEAEKQVDFEEMNRQWDRFEEGFKQRAKPIMDGVQAYAIEAAREAMMAEEPERLDELELPGKAEYKKALLASMREAYDWSKMTTAAEIRVSSPPTPDTTEQSFRTRVNALADKHYADMAFGVKKEALKELRSGTELSDTDLGISDAIGRIGAFFSGFFSKDIGLTGAIIIEEAIGSGRRDAFSSVRDRISRYQFSAVLDDRTCPICQDLDGMVLTQDEYDRTDWIPPIHPLCRCIWVAILDDEVDKPANTGMVEEAGGVSGPLLRDTVTAQEFVHG